MARIALVLALVAAPAWSFDANGVALGASEAEVLERYPAARCGPLQWKSDAADRRCDSSPIRFGGADARISFFLKADAVQAFDVRFEAQDLGRVAQYLKEHFGAPDAEGREKIERRGASREIYKLRWKKGRDAAVLTSQQGRRRVDLNVWRGNFDTEIYKFR